MNVAGGEMQNIHPVLQPYLETLSMFWDFEEKKSKKYIFWLWLLTKKIVWFFFF